MTSRYPVQIDSALNLPVVVDNFTPVTGGVVNRLRDAIINVEAELGIKPSALHGTVRARLDQIETIVGSLVAEGGGSGIPGGVATQVQFNDGGVFAGDAGLTYNKTTNSLFVSDAINIGDTTTIPQPAPVDGVTLYVDSGFLKYRRSDGNIIILSGANGIKIVADLTERDAIAGGDRYEAMLVYVLNDGSGPAYYQLSGGLTNADWSIANFVHFSQNLISASLTTGLINSTSLQSSLITNNGKFIVNGIDTFTASDADQGVIYYDLSENKFKVSENGGAYVDLLGGGGGGGSVTFAGDLSGSSSSQTVEKIHGATVPAAGGLTTNHVLMVNGSSALTYNLITNTNIDASAAIVYSKLSLTNSITNSDINASAAIAGSKINPDFGSNDVLTTGSVKPALIILDGDSKYKPTSGTGHIDASSATAYISDLVTVVTNGTYTVDVFVQVQPSTPGSNTIAGWKLSAIVHAASGTATIAGDVVVQELGTTTGLAVFSTPPTIIVNGADKIQIQYTNPDGTARTVGFEYRVGKLTF